MTPLLVPGGRHIFICKYPCIGSTYSNNQNRLKNPQSVLYLVQSYIRLSDARIQSYPHLKISQPPVLKRYQLKKNESKIF